MNQRNTVPSRWTVGTACVVIAGVAAVASGGSRARLYGGARLTDEDRKEPFREGDALRATLIDQVSCRKETHDFMSDGETTLKELRPGRTFRVTRGPKKKHYNVLRKAKGRDERTPDQYGPYLTPWFRYDLKLDGPGQYYLVAEMIDDRPRHMIIQPYVRCKETWFGSLFSAGAFGFYSGCDIPVSNEIFRMGGLIDPPPGANEVQVYVTSAGDLPPRAPGGSRVENGGAAVSRLWLYKVTMDYADHPNPIREPEGPNRRIGPYVPHENFWHREFGGMGATQLGEDAGRKLYRAAAERFADYMRYTGMNELQLIVTGDEGSTDEVHFHERAKTDFLPQRVLCRALQRHEVRFLPTVSTLGGSLNRIESYPSLSEEVISMHVSGRRDKGIGGMPNPARPAYQQVMRRFLREVAEFYEPEPNVHRLGMKGVFFKGGGWKDDRKVGPSYWGYSDWMLNRFEERTRHTLPEFEDKWAARAYLQQHAWDPWLRWRAHQSRALHTAVRDAVRSVDARYELLIGQHGSLAVKTPEKTWNYLVDEIPPERILLRSGLVPGGYRDEQNMALQQIYRVNKERTWARAHPHAVGMRKWNYDPRITRETYRTAEGNACMIAYGKWEVPNHPRVMDFSACTGPIMSGPERLYLRPMLHALRTKNPYSMQLYSWRLATRGRTHLVREFVRGYLALPRRSLETVKGDRDAKHTRGWVATCGDRVVVTNETNEARRVAVPASALTASTYREVVTGDDHEITKGRSLTLKLRPYDLRVLVPHD